MGRAIVREPAAFLMDEPLSNLDAKLRVSMRAALRGGAGAGAAARERAAFLMEEPLSKLDAKLRVSMRAALNQLHERLGTTTVYVTHDQVEAMTLGNRGCVLRGR